MTFRIIQDFRIAFRTLIKNPGFASIAIFAVALGIGINTAVFSAVNTVLLSPLPYPHPENLVRLWPSMLARGVPRASISVADYRDLSSKNQSLEKLAGYYSVDYNLLSTTQPERIHVTLAAPSLFQVIGVSPLVGNAYGPESTVWGSHHVVLLSERLWRQSFGANHSILGQNVTLNDQSYLVMGIMPASFTFPDETTQAWVPLSFAPNDPLAGGDHYILDMVGRLKPGADVAAARSELENVMRHINPDLGITIEDLKTTVIGDTRPTLLLLAAAVGLVLLIACTNVAGLLIVKANSRGGEFSVRVALGAARIHLMQQALIEGIVLSFIGGSLGLLLAFYLVQIIRLWVPGQIPRLQNVSIDYRVLLFTFFVSALTGLIFGIVPALRASKAKPADALKQISRVGNDPHRARRQGLVVISELSLSLALLICAGLLILSLIRLQSINPGFQPERTLTMRLNLSPVKYSKPEQGWNFIANVVRQLQTLPEVQNVGAVTLLPLTPGDWNTLFSGEGLPVPHSFAEVPVVRNVQVTPDYFRAIGATLRQGRYFSDHDEAKSPLVVIVNEALAHKFWPNGDALGKKFSPRPPEALIGLPPGSFPKFTIIGIVADMLHDGLDKQAKPTVYIPYLQAGQDTQLSLYLVLQMKTDTTPSLPQVLDRIHAADTMLPVADVQTMGQRISGSLARRSRIMWLLSIFAGSALLLAMVGVYGFFSSYVTQRTREVGLRMALGASGYDLLWLVLRQAGLLTGVGIVLGTIFGFILAELSKGLFFGVKPLNLTIYLGTSLLLLCVSFLGAYGPAKRASRVDPMQALRYE
jgi:putative ABC transport system permease protein